MPDAIITSTASTFGTISGTFAADQSTIVGTVTGGITGTISGSVGIPGPAGAAGAPGVGVPAGGASGQYLQKTSGADYATDWVTVNLSAYLTKAGNLSGLTDLATSRDNLGLGSLSTPTFAGVNIPGSGTSVANLGATFLTINQQGSGQFTIQPSQGIVFPDATVQTTAFTGAASTAWGSITGTLSSQTDLQTALNLKAPLASPALSGVPTAPTAATLTSTTQLATTAFVQQELLSGTANARNLEVYVRNQTGSTIPAGSIVYINGATGNRPTITLAQANNDANSAQTFGFTKASIANNGFGFVIVRGELENINTSALTEGVQLYLSPTTPGTWTTTKPSAPQHLVYVGIVVRAHPTQGVVLVAIQNGYEVGEIHDIQLGTLANNDLLAYESSTNLWKNKSFGTLGLLTSSALTGYATESWVTAQGYLTSSALTGYATESFVTSQGYLTDAPSDGNQYARQSGAWSVVSSTSPYITSVSSPLSVTSGDLSIDLSSYLTSATAASTYYPLTGNPSGFITSAALSTYAPLASPALTGNVSIVSNSTGAALFIEQSGSGNILTLHDQASDTTFVAIDQNGKVNTIPSVAAAAGFNIAHGTAPTTPVNGDVWTTTSGLFMRQNGSTQQYVDFGGTQTISGAKTFSNANQTLGNSTAAGTINVGTGATISGATKAVNLGTSGVAGSTTNIAIGSATSTTTTTVEGTVTLNGTALNLGNSTAASQINLGTGSTISGATKTIQIGSFAASGSTTNVGIANSLSPPSAGGTITIGTSGQTTTNLNGTVNATTASAGTSTTQVATTAFVTTADNLKANIASPSLTGTPLSTTAAADTNSTQIATTAYVVGQAGSATPLVNGTAAVGTSLRYARQDHVHPTDTSRAPLASPAFTGTPSLPTGTTAVTQTAGNNTTAVATTAFVQAALPAIATVAQTNSPSSNTLVMSPDKVRQMIMFPGFQQFLSGGSTGTSGTGAVAPSTAVRWRQFIGPNTATAGYSAFVFDLLNSNIGFVGSKRGSNEYGKNYARPLWMSGRTIIGTDDGGFGGDINNIFRCELGGRNNIATNGDPDRASLGWRVAGGGSQAIVFYMRSRTTINGGTYSETTTSFSPVYNQWFDWMVTYNGTDTCQMYVNDTLVGTISANFTGFQGESFNFYSERIEQTASAATRMEVNHLPPRIFFSE